MLRRVFTIISIASAVIIFAGNADAGCGNQFSRFAAVSPSFSVNTFAVPQQVFALQQFAALSASSQFIPQVQVQTSFFPQQVFTTLQPAVTFVPQLAVPVQRFAAPRVRSRSVFRSRTRF